MISAKQRDEGALKQFSEAMRIKLKQKRSEGRSGWQRMPLDDLWMMLIAHIKKAEHSEYEFLDESQLVDIANLAMFLWARSSEFHTTQRTCPHCGNPATELEES